LKDNIHDYSRGEQVTDGRDSALQQFFSTSTTGEQPKQVGRVPRLGIGEASANPQQDGHHRLQDETQSSGPGEPLRQFLEELSRESIHTTRLDGVANRERQRADDHKKRQNRHNSVASQRQVLILRERFILGPSRACSHSF
jgi:hypothetical protein